MNSITIDSTLCISDLCKICAQTGTDKTPYAKEGKHRHPYTAPYSLLFEPLRNKPIKFAEIGIAGGDSILAWELFFTKARIYGFDRDEGYVNHVRSRVRPTTTVNIMDASDSKSIHEVLKKYTEDGELFDVIIDDASHWPQHQQQVILTALHFLKPGGLLIIEDISREQPLVPYEIVFPLVKHLVSFHTFITCDHERRFSPGWNNDRLLVFIKA